MVWKFVVTGIIVAFSLFFIVRNVVDIIAIKRGKSSKKSSKYDDNIIE